MSRRVIHPGHNFTVSRVDPGARIEVRHRATGEALILSWADMVAMVVDLNWHIEAQQSADVTERPSAREVARERWWR